MLPLNMMWGEINSLFINMFIFFKCFFEQVLKQVKEIYEHVLYQLGFVKHGHSNIFNNIFNNFIKFFNSNIFTKSPFNVLWIIISITIIITFNYSFVIITNFWLGDAWTIIISRLGFISYGRPSYSTTTLEWLVGANILILLYTHLDFVDEEFLLVLLNLAAEHKNNV